MNPDIEAEIENKTLKAEFSMRNLDILQVWQSSPDNDLELENRQLQSLLDWVIKYQTYGDRKQMEAEGYLFPPISFDIDPDSDWLRFERWLQGKSVTYRLSEKIPNFIERRNIEDLTHAEIEDSLQRLIDQLAYFNIAVELWAGVPPRLVYRFLQEEVIFETFDITCDGWWHIDGCGGYCPGCFQRPWCEFGISSCWAEDEEAGKMYLLDAVQKYVQASAGSLKILQECQRKEDEEFAEFKESYKKGEYDIPF